MVKMKINCILLLISFASFSFISSEKSAFDCADNGLEKMDVAAANMLVLATQRKMPTSNQELETFCKDQRDFYETVRDYTKKCLKGFSKTLVTVSVYQNEKIHKGYCGKRKEKFISWGECGNKKRNETVKCFGKMIKNVDLARYESDNKNKFPLICCHFFEAKKCILANLKKVGNVCSSNKVSEIGDYIDRQAIETIKLLCGDYNENDEKCVSLIKNANKKGSSRSKYISPLIPMLEVIETL